MRNQCFHQTKRQTPLPLIQINDCADQLVNMLFLEEVEALQLCGTERKRTLAFRFCCFLVRKGFHRVEPSDFDRLIDS